MVKRHCLRNSFLCILDSDRVCLYKSHLALLQILNNKGQRKIVLRSCVYFRQKQLLNAIAKVHTTRIVWQVGSFADVVYLDCCRAYIDNISHLKELFIVVEMSRALISWLRKLEKFLCPNCKIKTVPRTKKGFVAGSSKCQIVGRFSNLLFLQ